MNTSKLKNTIILRNLPSNIIDEAIVFLKTNKKVKTHESIDESKNLRKTIIPNQSKEYIIKEAENVITSYISDIEEEKKAKNRNIMILENKYKRLKNLSVIMVAIIVFYTVIILVN